MRAIQSAIRQTLTYLSISRGLAIGVAATAHWLAKVQVLLTKLESGLVSWQLKSAPTVSENQREVGILFTQTTTHLAC